MGAGDDPMGSGGRPPPTAVLGPGFRFHPTDEELLRYYLKRKVLGKPVRFDCIGEIDLYKFDPWDLPGQSHLKTRDLEWYFFTALDRKYGHGSRTNRATGHGYWKTTGKDQSIIHQAHVVGMRKTLVYHAGRAPSGERTNWVMHEYRLEDEELAKKGVAQDAFVLCRIFEKSGAGPKNGEQYGAPFVEEEWEDEKHETTLLKENVGNGTANVGGILRAVTVNTMTPSSLPQKNIHQRVNAASETDHVALGVANTDLQFCTSHPCLEEQLLLDKKDGYTYGTEFSQEDCIEINDVSNPIDVGCPSCSYDNMLNCDVLCHDGHDICNELLLNEGCFLQYQDFLYRAKDDQLNHADTKLPEDDWVAEFLKRISDDDDKVQNFPTFDSSSPSAQQLRSIETSVNAERKGFTRTCQCKCSIKIER